jgi:dihydroorotate dehydrogenase electron transfer subunit
MQASAARLVAVVDRSTPMQGAIELVVRNEIVAAEVKPGQFFQIAVGAPHSLLRRPYSVAWTDERKGQFGFIFNVVGLGSGWLSERKPGDYLDLLGPLGRGFDLEGDRPAFCVAGGIGVAVFPGVVAALMERGRRVTVLLGARSVSQLLPNDRFEPANVRLATDDGSAGYRGSVVDLVAPNADAEILVCGPTPMLKALINRTARYEIPLSNIQVALETPMGCGLGTCLGCAAPSVGGGYLLTCQQGPCVRADRLDWTRLTDAFHG